MFKHWLTGLGLLLLFLVVSVLLLIFLEKKYFKTYMILKLIEFLVYFFLLGWTAGFWGFESVALSYMMIINILLVLVVLYYFEDISIIVLVVMIVLLLIDTVINYAFSENWYEPSITLLVLTFQILIFNY